MLKLLEEKCEPSKLARFLPRPPLNHDLRFREEFHRVAALAVQYPEKALFPSAEREVGHRRSHADIDPDIPRRRVVAEFPRRGPARREQRRLVAVRASPQKIHCLIHGVRVNQAKNRSENLRVYEIA